MVIRAVTHLIIQDRCTRRVSAKGSVGTGHGYQMIRPAFATKFKKAPVVILLNSCSLDIRKEHPLTRPTREHHRRRRPQRVYANALRIRAIREPARRGRRRRERAPRRALHVPVRPELRTARPYVRLTRDRQPRRGPGRACARQHLGGVVQGPRERP